MTDGLLSAADVRRLAARVGLKPTKTLGQNFVIDANTVRRIARAAALQSEEVVVEIGPGLGSLTLALLPSAARVLAVEIDPRLARQLPETVAERRADLAHKLTVICRNALQIEAEELPHATALVANLPYNVAVPVLLRMITELPQLQRVLVMVQSEVADRLCAGPGSRVYGAPSAKLAWWGSAKYAGSVSRSVFWPVPQVDSALVAVTKRLQSLERSGPYDRLATYAVIDAAFAQRRKTLRAALAGWAGSASEAERLLRVAGIDPSARGETLTIEDFARLGRTRPVASNS